MKSYVTSGTGSQQTLTGSQDEKVAVYQTLADAEADLANLEAGQIVATPDTGDENAQPVDVIQAGNMHAVTSNAVADEINSLDVPSVGGSGKYISAISEADGKINATASNLATSVTSGNSNPVTSSAVADKIASLGKQVLIYNGDTYDGTVKSLTQSLKNFRYLYIGLRTNTDYDYVLIPTDNINNGSSIMRTLMSSSNFGQVTLPFPYQSTVQVTILSDTTFKCESRYNNINWVLKVYAIWGIN